jgi:outer membrane protein OmpA-like peptidoglycan-associated protein
MSKRILIPIALLTAWLGGGAWYWVCQVRDACDDVPNAVSLQDYGGDGRNEAAGLIITYHDKVWLSRQEQLRFPRHEATADLSERMSQTFAHLAMHLQAHEELELEIIGSYSPQENNSSGSPNLGLGRAAFIQEILVGHGVPAERFIKLPKSVSDSLLVKDTLRGGIEMRLLDRQLGYGADSAALESLVRAQQAQVDAWAQERLRLASLGAGEFDRAGYSPKAMDSIIAAKQAQMNRWARERLKFSALEKGELNLAGYTPAEADSVIQARQAQMEAWARTWIELSALERGEVDLSGFDQATIDSLIAAKQAKVENRARAWLEPSALERNELSRAGYDSAAIEALIAERQKQVRVWAQARIEESPLERGEMSYVGYDSTTIESLRTVRKDRLMASALARAQQRGATRGGSPPKARIFHFAYNRFDLLLDDKARTYLTEVIQFMRQQPAARLLITGHTDNIGNAQENLALSKKRAETMMDFLEAFGLPRSRIQLAYKGDSQPVATNDTDQGRAQNRRVELVVQLP